jgi:hypothetical protein
MRLKKVMICWNFNTEVDPGYTKYWITTYKHLSSPGNPDFSRHSCMALSIYTVLPEGCKKPAETCQNMVSL